MINFSFTLSDRSLQYFCMFLISGLWVFYFWTITLAQYHQETVSQSSIRKKENDRGTSIVLPLQLYDLYPSSLIIFFLLSFRGWKPLNKHWKRTR